jgi:hypothetical protein
MRKAIKTMRFIVAAKHAVITDVEKVSTFARVKRYRSRTSARAPDRSRDRGNAARARESRGFPAGEQAGHTPGQIMTTADIGIDNYVRVRDVRANAGLRFSQLPLVTAPASWDLIQRGFSFPFFRLARPPASHRWRPLNAIYEATIND